MGIPLLELLRLTGPMSVPAEERLLAAQWIPKLGVKGKSQGLAPGICILLKQGANWLLCA
jgi:hypothetical protein